MTKRDVRISTPASPPNAPSTPAYVRVGMYLRDEQIALLDRLRGEHRAAGRRTISASDLARAALDVAERHPDEWEKAVVEGAR